MFFQSMRKKKSQFHCPHCHKSLPEDLRAHAESDGLDYHVSEFNICSTLRDKIKVYFLICAHCGNIIDQG
jgi:hypothetical protein